MDMTPDRIQKIGAIVSSVLRKIKATDIQKKVDLAVKFARSQPPVEITLDGATVMAIAVDIATVFSLEGNYRQTIDDKGVVRTVESLQALSIVLVNNQVHLCKSTYDVISGNSFEDDRFVNAMYWTTNIDQLTETYIC